jgi:hypothetical protein
MQTVLLEAYAVHRKVRHRVQKGKLLALAGPVAMYVKKQIIIARTLCQQAKSNQECKVGQKQKSLQTP